MASTRVVVSDVYQLFFNRFQPDGSFRSIFIPCGRLPTLVTGAYSEKLGRPWEKKHATCRTWGSCGATTWVGSPAKSQVKCESQHHVLVLQ